MKSDYIQQIKNEMSYITEHEEDDLEWYNEGLNLLEKGKFKEAERKFKELIVSQPSTQDGYEGLALTYEKLNNKKQALFFIKESTRKARAFMEEKMINEFMGETLTRIQQMN